MKGTIPAALAAAALLSLGLGYLWLLQARDFTVTLLDIPFVAALLLPAAPAIPVLLHRRRALFVRSALTAGSLRFWLAATLFPLAAAGAVYLYAASSAADFETTERYNALLISSALDLPLLFLRCLPLLAAQEIAWRLLFRADEGERGLPGAFASALLWLAAQGMFILSVFRFHGAPVAIAFAFFLFALGAFLFLLQERGSAYAAMWAFFLTLMSMILLFENRIPLIGRLLFGENNPAVEGILCINEVPYTAPLILLGGLFLLFALLLRAIPLTRRPPLHPPLQ